MKHPGRWIGIPLAVLAVVIVVLQAVGLWGLTGLVRSRVLPPTETALGVPLSVGHASANLMMCSLRLDRLVAANPDKYEEPAVLSIDSALVDADFFPLLGGELSVDLLTINGARLVISRHRDGSFNVNDIREALPAAEAPPPPAPADPSVSTPAATADGKPLPPLSLRVLGADLLIECIDHTPEDTARRMALTLRLTGDQLRTAAAADDDAWGFLELSGHLVEDPQAFVVNLTGRVAPLADPLTPTFTLAGSIASIDGQHLATLFPKLDVAAERASFDINLVCRNGRFDANVSQITARLHKARLTGETARKARATATVVNLSVPVPVAGTVRQPAVEWKAALTRALVANLTDNPDAILKALDLDDKKVGKDVEKVMRNLGDLLKNAP